MCGRENEPQGILCEWTMIWSTVPSVRWWGKFEDLSRRSWPFSSLQSNPFQNGEELAAVPLFLTKAVVLDIDLNLYRCISLGRCRNRSLCILNRFCVCVCACAYVCTYVGMWKERSRAECWRKKAGKETRKWAVSFPSPPFENGDLVSNIYFWEKTKPSLGQRGFSGEMWNCCVTLGKYLTSLGWAQPNVHKEQCWYL